MTTLSPISSEELTGLKGKTLIITGGASGIGRATVLIAHAAGANVAVADLSKVIGKELEAELKERILFVETDVTVWESVLALFETTMSHFGSIDAVYANAGGAFEDGFLENELDPAGKLKAPSMKNIEVNLHGVVYTTKAAIHFFEKRPGKAHQLILTGSAARQENCFIMRENKLIAVSYSFLDTPPLFLYGTSKAGVLGLMRGLRSIIRRKNITVNMIAPWMTITAQVPDWLKETWGDLPANDPSGVANALLLPLVRPELNGRTIWVAGNKAIELEQPLADTQPQWMGAELSAAITEGQMRMGVVNNLV